MGSGQEPDEQPAVHHRALPGGAVLTELQGAKPGPTFALLGGVHGDEDEGVLAVRRVVLELDTTQLAGTVRALAPAHPASWAAHSRFSPLDGANLARSFPGTPDAGPTSQLAASITEQVIRGADALVDLHSAGVRYRMPLMCGFSRDVTTEKPAQRLAEAFGAPIIWAHPGAGTGRSLSAAAELGVPAIYAESSGGGGVRASELDAYVRGVFGVMSGLGMLPQRFATANDETPRWVYGSGDLDHGAQARHDGLFVGAARAGEVVVAGAEIGRIYGYDGTLLDVLETPAAGMVMFLRRQARIVTGDVLYALAQLDDDRR